MTTAIVLLLFVATLVTLSIVRPGEPVEFPGASQDHRDQERQLAELRAMAAHSTWKVASRAASASTSRAASRVSGWNGSHRTSPSV